MDVKAITKFIRLSPSKVRDLAQRVQGLPVADALKVVDFSPRKGALHLGKAIKSAVANAENNANLDVETLRVKQAVVEEGPRLRRFWPRARGGASRIRKRMCHIRVVLSDGKDGESA